MASERESVVAGNEALGREVNEAVERGIWPGEEVKTVFRCECGRLGCAQVLPMTHEDYEAVRAHPRRFAAVPGHQDPRVEVVVSAADGWLTVEKRGAAGHIAEETDPRSD